jgi:hypothetical protein
MKNKLIIFLLFLGYCVNGQNISGSEKIQVVDGDTVWIPTITNIFQRMEQPAGYANTLGDTLTGRAQKLIFDTNNGNCTTTQITLENGFNVMWSNAQTVTGASFTPNLDKTAFRFNINNATATLNNATSNADGKKGNVYRFLFGNQAGATVTLTLGTEYDKKDGTDVGTISIPAGDSLIYNFQSVKSGGVYVLQSMDDLDISDGVITWAKLAQAVKDSIDAGGGGTGIDTLYDYTALRAYTGTSLAVYVNKTGLAGLFRRVPTGTENYGTIIVASNSVVWRRDVEKNNDRVVDWFGAVGDGTTSDGAAINLAISAAGGFLAGGNIHFTPGKTYLIDRTIDDPAQNYSINYFGYGATVKRKAATKTNLTANAASGATTISVADTTGFRVGDAVMILDTTSANAGRAFGDGSTVRTISSRAAGSLTLSGTVVLPSSGNLNGLGYYPSGCKVVRIYDMFGCSEAVSTNFYGLTFDGNQSQNTHYYGWVGGSTINILGTNSTVQDCKFNNIANENIFFSRGAKIINNTANNLYGSFSHASSNTARMKSLQSGNTIEKSCWATFAVNGHGEAAFTCSNNSDTMIITNNHVLVGGGMFFGYSATNDDAHVIITGNEMESLAGGCVGFTTSLSAAVSTSIIFSNNNVTNCKRFKIEPSGGGSAFNGCFYREVIISNNNFYNTRLQIANVAQLKITNNNFAIKYGYTDATYSPLRALIDIGAAAGKVEFSGNKVEQAGPSIFEYGIDYGSVGSAPSLVAGTLATYGKFQITNNTVFNFRKSIGPSFTKSDERNWTFFPSQISGNTIMGADTVTSILDWGIMADPGFLVTGNYLFGKYVAAHTVNTDLLIGIFAQGVDSLYRDSVTGPVITNNVVTGYSESIQATIGCAGGGTDCGYNVTIFNNIYDKLFDDNCTTNTTTPCLVYNNVKTVGPTYHPRVWVSGYALAPSLILKMFYEKFSNNTTD